MISGKQPISVQECSSFYSKYSYSPSHTYVYEYIGESASELNGNMHEDVKSKLQWSMKVELKWLSKCYFILKTSDPKINGKAGKFNIFSFLF